MPAVTLLGRLKSVPPSKCFPFSNISSTQWGPDALTEIKAEKRNTEKISLPDTMSQWQCPFQNEKEEQGGGNVRKLPCWGCVSQAGLGPGSSPRKSKRSSAVSFSSWQWALLSLGISNLCGSRHGTSASPKPIGLPLFQLAALKSIKLLYSPTVHYWPGRSVLKLRMTGGRP